MSIAIAEKIGSGELESGDNPGAQLVYLISGTSSEASALSKLEDTAPDPHEGLSRKGCSVEPYDEVAGMWEGTAVYAAPEEVQQEVGESTYRFSTGGGSQHITTSRGTTAYVAAGTAPDYKSAIGVTKDGVEGVDILVPKFEWSETHTIAAASVTTAYIAILRKITGKTNSGAWQGYAAGEVLFLGAEGSKNGGGDWDITFNFAAGENVAGQTIGAITGVAKKAWQYLWVRFKDVEDTTAKAMVKQPQAVYVETVYPEDDFSTLTPAP